MWSVGNGPFAAKLDKLRAVITIMELAEYEWVMRRFKLTVKHDHFVSGVYV